MIKQVLHTATSQEAADAAVEALQDQFKKGSFVVVPRDTRFDIVAEIDSLQDVPSREHMANVARDAVVRSKPSAGVGEAADVTTGTVSNPGEGGRAATPAGR